MRRLAVGLCALVFTTGCFHSTIETGAAPSGQVVDKPWAHGFLFGLVPPSNVETAAKCPSGVSKVETQQSFLNLVANALTGGIYSPMAITVTCGTGKTAVMPTVRGTADVAASLSNAVEVANATGAAVRLELPQ